MAHISKDENLDKLRGSELHHDLKNRPGEKGDPNHASDGTKLETTGKSAPKPSSGD